MDLNQLSIFKVMGSRMSYLAERQKVLAGNIANADTPHYAPSDLKEQNFKAALQESRRVRMAVTNPIHLAGTAPSSDFGVEKAAFGKTYETSPNGNGVILEEQMMKVGQVQSSYQLTANLYQKNMSMLRTAIGRAQ